ncbi:unnamed protein product [Peniophora sp. CBMAI 1063]|nr:unnamed protein product [Peniophora sp. CBMAI 1063]
MSLGLESNQSYVDPNARAQGQVVESGGASCDDSIRSESEKDEIEEVHRYATCSDAERVAQPPRAGSNEASFGDASALA